ncbi:Hypothetical protein R9X50_00615100 [Acrodontium crateriforme]|uniref:Uncharacterized protein n=1 Tax=Acrodontium crateriforme TaxID=150365 RepID=A0AAQ3M7T5_9PEZI|nr:Hypothetical protein R9X50_00615100 [Acrodontium crateriforme]
MPGLEAPPVEAQDPGAHDLSDSEDHFSSASEGHSTTNSISSPKSPIPITRVERVDDEPAHGEVPGTPAYAIRTQDAVPDEIEVIPDGQRSRSGTRTRGLSNLSQTSRPGTPGGSSIPKTVVERVDDKPAHGEVEGTLAKEMRGADAVPDEVRQAPHVSVSGHSDGRADEESMNSDDQQAWFRSMWEGKNVESAEQSQSKTESIPADGGADNDDDDDDDDGFGDDFDEFAEEGGDDDDFGDFDEAEDAPMEPTIPVVSQPAVPDILANLPCLDFSLPQNESEAALDAYLAALYPPSDEPDGENQPAEPSKASAFLSDRSLSLWQQLVSPPPMQPPNWTRSRIRRLFLVSLGVPVDLDEILPPSKQKRLILPNINLPSGSPRASSAVERLKQGSANNSTTSVDSKTGQSRRSKQASTTKGPPQPPDFDLNAASLLCSTTAEAMGVYSGLELKAHVSTLQCLNSQASKVLEYWLQRKDDALKEKEALEGVIENLVGFVKGMRGK